MNAFDVVRIHKFGRLDDKGRRILLQASYLPSKKCADLLRRTTKAKLAIALERQQEALEEFSDDTDWLSRLEYEPRSRC